VRYAVEVARQSGAKQLALFHHDPAHDDDSVDRLLCAARAWAAEDPSLQVVAASEGLRIALG
jgi:ribonuclease BN (tRNA processing enzyme)